MVPLGFMKTVEENIEHEARNGYVMHSDLPTMFLLHFECPCMTPLENTMPDSEALCNSIWSYNLAYGPHETKAPRQPLSSLEDQCVMHITSPS